MIRRAWLALCLAASVTACATARHAPEAFPHPASLAADLDRLLAAPALARARIAVRVDDLATGRTLYARDHDKLVVPASNLKLLTLAAAAARLGWSYTFETTLEAAGTVTDGTLAGDLVVTGSGDPSVTSPDLGHPALFLEWADALRAAGITRVSGRLIGDDNAFDDEGLGPGWAWDYLDAAYAAPSGALNYQENVVAIRIAPGAQDGDPVLIVAGPPGAPLELVSNVRTGPADSPAVVRVTRAPASTRVTVTGQVPAGGVTVSRLVTVPNPTLYFVGALREALTLRGIEVAGGAWDIDDLAVPVAEGPRLAIARRDSAPLSELAGHLMKTSQNLYGEVLLKALGRAPGQPGSTATGRLAAQDALVRLGIVSDAYVMHDGSGLSRYSYVTADAIVTLLTSMWRDEQMRGPFVASLPVGGEDGTLANRMRDPALAGRVRAKTGSISNMRALSGYLTTDTGDRFVFSMIANHFTAPAAEVDRVMEGLLRRISGYDGYGGYDGCGGYVRSEEREACQLLLSEAGFSGAAGTSGPRNVRLVSSFGLNKLTRVSPFLGPVVPVVPGAPGVPDSAPSLF